MEGAHVSYNAKSEKSHLLHSDRWQSLQIEISHTLLRKDIHKFLQMRANKYLGFYLTSFNDFIKILFIS